MLLMFGFHNRLGLGLYCSYGSTLRQEVERKPVELGGRPRPLLSGPSFITGGGGGG